MVPDFVVANSFATLDSLRLPNRVPRRVIYEGIVARAAAPKNTNISPRIGLVGRLARWKGQHIFLSAAAQVRRQFPSARFEIIGSAMFGEETYEQEIRAQTTALELDDCVEFTGFRRDVPQRIDQLDVLVHASTTGEPFGQVITEGMIAGKPVVATHGGGVPEIVVHGVTGLLVPMGDADEMAKAICWLLANPEQAHTMGEAGRERALNHFTVDKTAPLLEGVFEEVLGELSQGSAPIITCAQESFTE
ncbi:MAG: glycosyltransferase [Verrucomicrobiota bacterium]